MSELFNEPCPGCGHAVQAHFAEGCQQQIADAVMVKWGGEKPNDVGQGIIPQCGCQMLKCECGHYVRDHREDGCHLDPYEGECSCKVADSAIYQEASQ